MTAFSSFLEKSKVKKTIVDNSVSTVEKQNSIFYITYDASKNTIINDMFQSNESSESDDSRLIINPDIASDIRTQGTNTTPEVREIINENPIENIILLEPTPENSPDEESFSISDDDVVVEQVFADGSERSQGLTLNEDEKPKILAILAENMNRGFPSKNIIFFKKLISNRAYAKKYTIFRKKVFIENDFQKLTEIIPSELTSIPSDFNFFLDKMTVSKNQIFIYEDLELERDQVYIYKMSVNWSLGNSDSVENNDSSFLFPLFFSGTF